MAHPAYAVVGLIAVAALAGCASPLAGKIQGWVADDAAQAQVMAEAAAKAGDATAATRAQCYAAFASLANVAQGGKGPQLVFVPVESSIEISGAINRPECQALAGQFVVNIVQKFPVGLPIP
jgi:hypothetical protein